jgi:2',3'-cyclic-nucleotide 2'-phosphodiesterase (5'-nucleotidase family)
MRRILLFSFLAIFSVSCSYVHFTGSGSALYKTEEYNKTNSSLDSLINPYRKKVDLEMNVVIGELETTLKKAQPESNLGNWAADALFEQAKIYSGESPDFSLLNYGGLRIGSISAGPITKGKIYELMPFDNSVVIVEMPGEQMNALFDHVIAKGGWPISSNLRIVVGPDNKITELKINGENIDNKRIYKIATIDYLANGGDNCSFFIGKKQIQTAVFLRDAIIENTLARNKVNKKIFAEIDGRFIIKK